MKQPIIQRLAILCSFLLIFASCSNDELDQIENQKIIGYHNPHTELTYRKDKVKALPVIKEYGNYTVFIFHTAEELAEADIRSYSIPGISFNPGFTKLEYDNFWKECRNNNNKSASVVKDFSDIDRSKQSLVFIMRSYNTYDMTLVNVTGKVYRNGLGFVINLRNEILFSKGIISPAMSYCGIAVLVNKPNLLAKDLKIHLDNAEYTIYMNPLDYDATKNEKRVNSKWLKL